ncbi:hypothetical protein EJ06DRAFT_546279 [Trichodelitschia bisporula]|uniref:Uncharacterized protein n=1 Tax=Trichodelitschia bisporula TaxID=703511 RepID=A0A6G1I7T9_9PEZI|nr:hypothetical protein EJ06DRAFT_546279 [Trichodelitschia bisporula]
MADTDDPFDWSVDQVIAVVCHSRTLWTQHRPYARLPDPDHLAQLLQDNDVDGAALLSAINPAVLKEDFGIKSLGQRDAIIWGIERLRHRSAKYQAHNGANARMLHAYLPTEHAEALPPPSIDETALAISALVDTDHLLERSQDEEPPRKKQKRLVLQPDVNGQPVSATSHLVQQTHQLNPDPETVPAFLKPAKLTVDMIYFGKNRIGRAVNPEIDLAPIDGNIANVQGIEFFRAPCMTLPGAQKLVNRSMKTLFLRSEEVNTTVGNQPAIAMFLGPRMERSVQSVILFRSSGLQVDATRELATVEGDRTLIANVPAVGDDDPRADVSDGQWDFLLYRPHSDDEELPAYGESEADTEMSLQLAQMEADRQQDEDEAHQDGPMSTEAVTAVIEREVSNLEEIWTAKILPKRQLHARAEWLKPGSTGARYGLAEVEKDEIDRLTRRLSGLKANILEVPWTLEADLVKMCDNLDQTVKDLQDYKWKRQLLLQRVCPDSGRMPPAQVSRKRARSASSSANSSPDDFIEHDDQMAMGGEFRVHAYPHLDFDSDGESDDSLLRGAVAPFPPDSPVQSDSPVPVGTHDAPVLETDPDFGRSSPLLPESGSKTASPIEETVTNDEAVQLEDHTIQPPPAARNMSGKPRRSLPGPGENVVDLTFSSDEEGGSSSLPVSSEISGPGDYSNEALSTLDLMRAEGGKYRKAIIAKLIRGLPTALYTEYREWVLATSVKILCVEVVTGVERLHKHSKEEQEWPEDFIRSIVMGRLYVCWCRAKAKQFSHKIIDGKLYFSGRVATNVLKNILEKCPGNRARLQHFCRFIKDHVFEPYEFPLPARRMVAESQEGKQQRQYAMDHSRQNEERTKLTLEKAHGSLSQTGHGEIINLGKRDHEEFVYINKAISDQMPKHQLDGVRFLWREIADRAGTKNGRMPGCLLSHTMGLGKTIQAITLIITIAETVAAGGDLKMQLAKELRDSQTPVPRTLIACPASLVTNWLAEFEKWTPDSAEASLGRRYDLRDGTHEKRLQTAEAWYNNGGVLLCSYELLRGWIKQGNPNVPKSHQEMVLNGATLIVADEAHNFKNVTTANGIAMRSFQTKFRVALTGSPLSNNLKEYHALVDWVAPGYLGPAREFNANYVKPIADGLYAESSKAELRYAMVRLKAIETLIAPKVHRRGMEVLEQTLPPKQDFVLRIALTATQTALYKAYIRFIAPNCPEEGVVPNTKLWAWLGGLGLIVNHPSIFWGNVLERMNSSKPEKPATSPQALDQADAGGSEESNNDINAGDIESDPERLWAAISPALEMVGDVDNITFSNKVTMMLDIVKGSLKLGDRTIVFSQSIDTLNFIGSVLNKHSIEYARLDGRDAVAKRTTIVSNFNRGVGDVFLISTRAGGVGINIPGANRVILFDSRFNPQWEEQAIGRVYRMGQTKPVYTYRFVTEGSFEHLQYNNAVYKIQLAYRVLENENPIPQAVKSSLWFFDPKPARYKPLEALALNDTVLEDIVQRDARLLEDEKRLSNIEFSSTLKQVSTDCLTEEEVQEARKLALQRDQLIPPGPGAPTGRAAANSAQSTTMGTGQQYPNPASSSAHERRVSYGNHPTTYHSDNPGPSTTSWFFSSTLAGAYGQDTGFPAHPFSPPGTPGYQATYGQGFAPASRTNGNDALDPSVNAYANSHRGLSPNAYPPQGRSTDRNASNGRSPNDYGQDHGGSGE